MRHALPLAWRPAAILVWIRLRMGGLQVSTDRCVVSGAKSCPSCPDGYVWDEYGQTDEECPVCQGHAIVTADGKPLPEHEWGWRSDWMGDPSIPNGTMDCSGYECRLCGETKSGSPPKRERDVDDYEFRGFGYRRKE